MPKCDYLKNGKLLKSRNLKYYVSNIKFLKILFINFQCKTHNKLIDLNKHIKDIFKHTIDIYEYIFILIVIIYVPTEVYFTAEILNLEINISGLENDQNYYYDSMNDNDKIVLVELSYDNMIKIEIVHLLVYIKID